MTKPATLDCAIAGAGLLLMGMVVQPSTAHAGPEEDAFNAGGYSSCDAKLVALAWSTTDIKGTINDIGSKLKNGYEDQVKEALASGREINADNLLLCPPEELYSTADIDAFGLYWDEGRKTARDSISKKLLAGEKSSIDDAIAEGKKKG